MDKQLEENYNKFLRNLEGRVLNTTNTLAIFSRVVLKKDINETIELYEFVRKETKKKNLSGLVESSLKIKDLDVNTFISLIDFLTAVRVMIKDDNLKELCGNALKDKAEYEERILYLCNHIASLRIKGYCSFFKDALSIIAKKNAESANLGVIALMAAKLKCFNCTSIIENIVYSNKFDNPKTKYFAEKALKKIRRSG